MERWVVQMDAGQVARLNHEQRELGTLLSNEKGEHFLVLRDGFVALKVASSIGAIRSPGRTLPAESTVSFEPLAHFNNGDLLILEHH